MTTTPKLPIKLYERLGDDAMTELLTLFGDLAATGSITKDEESSGVIDVTEILGRRDGRIYNLFVAQVHASSGDPETVQIGQLMLMSRPASPRGDNHDGERDEH